MNRDYFMCLVAHTNTIRTVANYPDGSPCGEGNYCIKGECRPLLCGGSTIAQSIIDCPAKFAISPSTQALLSRKRRPFKSGAMNAVVHNGSTKGNSLKPSKNRASKIVQSGGVLTNSTTDHPPMKQWTRIFPTREQASEWTEWSPFSECISYACGVPGMKVRVRKCKSGGKCVGPSRERIVCRIPCGHSPQIISPPVIERKSLGGLIRGIESQDKITRQLSVWGSWSECSRSCGVGIRKRRKKFCKTNCFDYSNCSLGACPTSSPPEAEAEPPAQQRAAESVSIAAESPIPPTAPEDISTLPPSTPSTSPPPETGRYTEWSNWNNCSSCDSVRSRMRVCIQAYCNRPLREDQLCNTVLSDCPLFTSWSEWSTCGGGCEGSGRRHRRRTCYKGICNGFDAESEPCFNPTCKKRIRRVTKVSNSVNTRGGGGGRDSGII
ncbi:hypothetical protein WR25_11717 [Diploscapter pachys]|uniref:Adt-1/2-like domain-containing protein n=1 Tax=Diploscapter pachys TaxID=2018661 RepID=A0A2A2KPB6_9BILA|nr:hypothetical protein WR25_11717 [Diploscapter pachys]